MVMIYIQYDEDMAPGRVFRRRGRAVMDHCCIHTLKQRAFIYYDRPGSDGQATSWHMLEYMFAAHAARPASHDLNLTAGTRHASERIRLYRRTVDNPQLR